MGMFKDATIIVCAWQQCCVNIGSTQSRPVAASQRPVYRRSAWIDRRELHCKLPCNLMPNVACLLASNAHSYSEAFWLKILTALYQVWWFHPFTEAINIVNCCQGEEIYEPKRPMRGYQAVMRRNVSAFLCYLQKIQCHFISPQSFNKAMVWIIDL